MSYPLYANFKIEVPFAVVINCIITSISPEFTTTSATYYINDPAKIIDLSAVVYNQIPLCRLEQSDKFTITVDSDATSFVTVDIQQPKLTIVSTNSAHARSSTYSITVANAVTILSSD